MAKYFKKKVSITISVSLIVIALLLGVAYSNWLAPTVQNYYQKLQVFTTVFRTIQAVYVDEPDPIKLINDAIKGMVKNLDPHTTYMTKEEIEKWRIDYQGYSGIGIRFDIIDKKITIMSVIEGGPSYKLGFQPGDRIIKINGENAIGIKRDDVPKKLMGPAGTTVDVTIERESWEKPRDFTIVREKINVESIPTALMLNNEVGYIRITHFSSTTGDEIEQALQKLEKEGMKSLILDLRNNNGGYLQMAVEVAEKFLPENKMIVYTKGRVPSAYREFHSSGSSQHRMLPLIVLINHQSASASEIVAGAIQDWDRGLIVGQTSFGKGLVQTQYPMSDGSVLHITTARYYTPSGRMIQRDYTDKSYEEYLHEAFNDSLREAMLKTLPKYKTFAGRTVYGGGGIHPDIWLEDKSDPPSEFVINLYYDSNRYIYRFSEQVLHRHPEIKQMTALEFAQNFEISDEEITRFAEFVIGEKYKASPEDFKEGSKDLKYLIKREIAYRLWSEEGQFYVNYLRDTVLKQAKDLFPDAKRLLAMSTLTK